jgi:two-component system OmpR family sensor kinase
MLFDDRLATVLGTLPGGATAARTQYRQLVDLLGSATGNSDDEMDLPTYRHLAAQAETLSPGDRERMISHPALTIRDHRLLTFLGWQRLEELAGAIPAEERSRILREPGLRLRNPHLVALLAQGDAKPAAAALATARLTQSEWQDLIPRLSVMARGFLRHRRDLPDGARDLLRQLGVNDLVLPLPDGFEPEVDVSPTAPLAAAPEPTEDRDGIRALLRRIEAFREGRRAAPTDPRLPLGDAAEESQPAPLHQFAFTADTQGRIDWAEGPVAPLVCGMRFGEEGAGAVAALARGGVRAMNARQPLTAAPLTIDALPAISGEWRVDAEPVFALPDGRFAGYRGRIRRPVAVPQPASVGPQADTAQDRMRQVLHELRTPVNAIQGFAEIIQQQLFGPAPNAYRAHAAAIAVDAAKLLAGFEEIDRLSKLESGALELDAGETDLRAELTETVRRMEGVLRARSAGFDLADSDEDCTLALARDEVRLLCWRLLASLAGSLAPGERLPTSLAAESGKARLAVAVPQAMRKLDDPFATGPADQKSALSAGMFGQGFALRLARAEVVAASGDMIFVDGMVHVTMPLLTAN